MINFMSWLPIAFIGVALLFAGIKILAEYERGVVYRLGRCIGQKGPGLIFIIPGIDKLVKVSLRTVVLDVPPQDIITKDNVTLKVNAVVYFRVMDPALAINEVEDYLYATSQLAQTTLRSILGESELDELLSSREKINKHLQTLIDKQTDPWGVKVSTVEIKHVDLPDEMKRAMAKQAEAERERRSKIIAAEGEAQASAKLLEAAKVLSQDPTAVQLRYLQTLAEISVENNTTTIFPVPLNIFDSFMKK